MSEARVTTGKYNGADVLRTIACIFIFLYHCNTILPGEWKFITWFGEDIGNGLFFALSGFGLFPSIVKTPVSGFGSWYLKRVKKILPIVIAAYVLSYLTGYFRVGSLSQALVLFVYPSLYWFVSAILISYVPLFFLGKLCRAAATWFIVPICLIFPFFMPDLVASRFTAGLGYMLCGFCIRKMLEEKDKAGSAAFARAELLAGSLMLIAYACMKSRDMMTPCRIASVFICPILLISVCCAEKEGILRFKEGKGLEFVSAIGKMALTLYIVQCFNGGMIGFYILQHVKFPLSFPVNLVVVWGLTAAVHKLFSLMRFHRNQSQALR